MAVIPIPVTKTLIASAAWGIPLTNQLNTNTTDIAALKAVPAWTNATLQNGWVSVAPTVAYCKLGYIVYVRGMLASGANGSVVFTLPVGFRVPANMSVSTAYLDAGAWKPGRFYLQIDGTCTVLECPNTAGGVLANYYFFIN